MKDHLLAGSDLQKRYGDRTVVRGVSVDVSSNEIVGLLGPNGAGKTTTFYMMVGLVAADAGAITLDQAPITREPMYLRARRGLAYLPQEASIFRKLSVHDNIMAVLETIEELNTKQRKERLEKLLEELSVTHIRNSLGASLSGGERRRVEIARSLARDPKFLLLDEPFAGIDPLAVDDIQEIISGLRDKGLGILITDHNVRETLGICDRAYIMVDGKILEEGVPEHIAQSENARRFYLGQDFSL